MVPYRYTTMYDRQTYQAVRIAWVSLLVIKNNILWWQIVRYHDEKLFCRHQATQHVGTKVSLFPVCKIFHRVFLNPPMN